MGSEDSGLAAAGGVEQDKQPVLVASHLFKSFGGVAAVEDVSLVARAGQVHAVIGSNGAGKTTLLNLMTGQLSPDRGSIEFLNRDVSRWPVWRRARAGFGRAFQVCRLFDEMTVEENLRVGAALAERRSLLSSWGSATAKEQAEVEHALSVAELGPLRRRVVGELSQGDRKRTEVALTVAMGAKALCLDEPFAGVGKAEVVDIVALIRDRAASGQMAVIVVEHDVDVVFSLADEVTMLHAGAVIASGTPGDVMVGPAAQEIYFTQKGVLGHSN